VIAWCQFAESRYVRRFWYDPDCDSILAESSIGLSRHIDADDSTVQPTEPLQPDEAAIEVSGWGREGLLEFVDHYVQEWDKFLVDEGLTV